MPTIQRFAENALGVDYVVGDIHGCFDQLEAALARAHFNPAQDRLFGVGDLVDRGPGSAAAMDWLARPWFHACLGNHEAMALSGPGDRNHWLWWVVANGGEWWLDLAELQRQRYLDAFAGMPLAMEIETAAGHVGVVHADVPPELSWPEFVLALERNDPAARECALWGRARAQGLVDTPVSGIDRVVCGHSIAMDRQAHVVGNVWLIDTGAFLLPGSLTVLPLSALFA